MIDIIIPYYNSRNTLARCLGSIVIQNNREDLKVTIVDDCSTEDFIDIVDIFRPLLNIQVLRLEINSGPGVARQYGIDHTNEEFITFIDSDDTFADSFSLGFLVNDLINEPEADMVISSFLEEGSNHSFIQRKNDVVWVFGKMYKRSFIKKYNISFLPIRSNEDTLFNLECVCLSNKSIINNNTTYIWHWNSMSITRKDNGEYKITGRKDLLLNFNKIAEHINKYSSANLQFFQRRASLTFVHCFILYNELIYKKETKMIKDLLGWLKIFYKKIIITYQMEDLSMLENMYKDTLQSEEYLDDFYLPLISFPDFIKELKKNTIVIKKKQATNL